MENNQDQEIVYDGPTIIEEVKDKPTHDRFYVLKHAVQLISGWTLVGLLTTTFGIVINDILTKKEDISTSSSSYAYFGGPYTFLLTAILIFGGVHIFLVWWLGNKKSTPPTEKSEKVAHVLSTIFAVGLIMSTIGFIVSLVYPLLGSALGIIDMENREIAKVILTSISGIIVSGGMTLYHIKAFKKFDWQIFSVALGGLAIIAIILFVVYPANKVRNPLHDKIVADDLSKIAKEISTYYSKHNSKLPESLKTLDVEDLKYSLSNYKYSPKSTRSSSDVYSGVSAYGGSTNYELCANFKTDTESDSYSSSYSSYDSIVSSSYRFTTHAKGEHCFTVSASSYYANTDEYLNTLSNIIKN